MNTVKFTNLLVAVILLAAASCTPAQFVGGTGKLPKAKEGTRLRQIQDRGKLIAGVKYDVPTFGFLDPATKQLSGFDIDLVRAIAAHIFGDPQAVEFREAATAERVSMLKNGSADLVASTMTITEGRMKEIDFSDVYYVAGQTVLVRKSSSISGVSDLTGLRIGTLREATSDVTLRQKATAVNVVLFDNSAQAVAALDAETLDAFSTDDVILNGYAKQSPDKYKVVGNTFTVEPYGIGVAKGQPELLDAVNQTLRKLMDDGSWAKIYETNLPVAKAPLPPPRFFPPVH